MLRRICATSSLCVCLSLSLTGCIHPQKLQPYVGEWVLNNHGRELVELRIKGHRGGVVGTLTAPKHLTEGPNGGFSGIAVSRVTKPLSGSWGSNKVVIMVGQKHDRTKMTMVLRNSNHLSLDVFGGAVPPWEFTRVTSATIKTTPSVKGRVKGDQQGGVKGSPN